MIRVLHAEWTKLRTEPAAGWLLPGMVVATVLTSLLAVAAARCERGGCGYDPAALSLTGVQLGQVLVVLLAAWSTASLFLGAIFLHHRDA